MAHYQQQQVQQHQHQQHQQVHSSVPAAPTTSLTTNHSSPTSAHSPNLTQPPSSHHPSSTTPVSSSYSHSNSSQHDLSSPPHFTAMPATDSALDAYQSPQSSSSTSATRVPNVLDSLDTAMNGSHHPGGQPFRNINAFNTPFSTTFSPVHGGPAYHSLALQPPPPPPPPPVSSQQQATQRQSQPFRGPDHLSPSAGSFSSSQHSHYPTSPPTYPTKADVFGTGQPIDALGRYDLDGFGPHDSHGPPPQQQHQQQQQQQSQGLKMPQTFNAPASFNLGGTASSSALLQTQQVSVSKLSATAATAGSGAGPQGFGTGMNGGNTLPYMNGVGQTQGPPPPPLPPPQLIQGPPGMNGVISPFGGPTPLAHAQHPMLHAPGPGPGVQAPHVPQAQQAQQQQQQQQQSQQSQQQQVGRSDQLQEEISTIFVVGFPDDMQEREFQNMFTFSVGFEAATLKIPNKDSSAYGPASASTRQAYGHGPGGVNGPYSGAQDPYNLVTVNSGGVVVDGPQGTSSSWQQGPDYSGDGAHGQPTTMPPRKQIIGFAKFRTRQEALDARDLLQGRRVDIEKGAVLKAEMAKKNLHTKRGVGPLGLPVALMGVAGANANTGVAVVAPDILPGMSGMNGFTPNTAVANLDSANVQLHGGSDALGVRDRQMGALSAMGLGGGSSTRRQDDDKDRRPSRVEEEDQRRKKEKEQQERNNKLRMSNVQVYDAFHSVPAENTRRGSSAMNGSAPATGPLSPPAGFGDTSSTFPGFGFNTNGGPSSNTFQLASNGVGTIGQGFQSHGFSNSEALSSGSAPNWGPPGKLSLGDVHKIPARPPSAQSSPPSNFDAPYIPSGGSNRGAYYNASSDSSAFSPPEYSMTLPPIGPRPRAHSPSNVVESHTLSSGVQTGPPSLPRSSASSVAGSQSSLDEHFARTTLNVSTHQGMTSPQLPSPGSGGSSSTNMRQGNASDQNPPINTLYVGNLPNSPMPPGYAPNYLEEALKSLFSQCKGYRKLCFRQKSNGPMCFVEFEDVQHATKALNELYGNQLNGFVKGGIRLSFSKNPLGVRPPPPPGPTSNPPTVRRESSREGWNGPIQPSGAPGMNYASIRDAFPPRPLQPPPQGQQQPGPMLDVATGRPCRLDLNDVSPPANAGFPYNMSSPPSRFFSPPPSQSSFGTIVASAPPNGFSRSSSQAFGPPSSAVAFGPNSPPFTSTPEDERIRFRDVQFAPSPGLETTRVG